MIGKDIVDNAPEGATHIDVIGQYWMRFNGYRNKRWNKISMEWMPSPNCNLARSLSDIKRIAELEKELESALYFNIDVTRCLSKIAWEHNHDEIPAYMELSRKCIKSIESKQIEALKEQVKCE